MQEILKPGSLEYAIIASTEDPIAKKLLLKYLTKKQTTLESILNTIKPR